MAELTVREVVGDVLGEVAHEELPLFSEFDDVDDATVDRALRPRGRTREPLGFGLESVEPLVTPVLWGVVINFATTAAGAGISGAVKRLRMRRRRRDDPAEAEAEAGGRLVLPPMDRDTIDKIEQLCLEQCVAAGLDEARAAHVAAALAARLRRHSAGTDPGSGGSADGADPGPEGPAQ